MKPLSLISLLSVVAMLLPGCTQSNQQPASGDSDPTSEAITEAGLPSWNDGAAKEAITEFVARVTDPSSPDFVPEPERIATFDNDGCLWSEKPFYFQLLFAVDRVSELAPEHPEWRDTQPFRGAIEGDLEAVAATGEHGLLELVMASHAGMTTAEFEEIVENWLATARHPELDRPYTELVFQPMLELLDYLRAHEFKTFITSGGGIEFMRPWVEVDMKRDWKTIYPGPSR